MSDKAEALERVLDHYGSTGRNVSGMRSCVFHADRTPSMSVNLRTGLYNCHSCGRGGDAFSLVEEKEGVEFLAAKAFIAGLGVNIATEREVEEVTGSIYGGRRTTTKKKGATSAGYKPSWKR